MDTLYLPAGLLLAHGVGRIYELPVPLSWYLVGSALAVAGALVVTARMRSLAPGARQFLSARAARLLGKAARVAVIVGFVLALLSAATGTDTAGFNFGALWVWMGLIVGLVILNVVIGGLWRPADPFVRLARLWRNEDEEAKDLPWWLGPLALYLLFWFELVSGVGFEAGLITPLLIGYGAYAVWIRAKFRDWEDADPFVILYRFASRASFLRWTREGVIADQPGSPTSVRGPMSRAVYVALFILLGATSLDNLRETETWASMRSSLGLPGIGVAPGADMAVDTIALAILGLPFFFTFRLVVRRSARILGVGYSVLAPLLAWSLAPIAIVYVLAHNAALFLFTLRVWPATLLDPLALGWFSGLTPLSGYEPSPASVWFLEVSLVVAGHVVGVFVAHRLAQRFERSHGTTIRSQIPMTLLMTLYTVGTLWLLSLAVVTSG